MRAVLQRVSEARVRVEGRTVGRIGPGLVVLLGVTHADGEEEVRWMARKTWQTRLFDGERSAEEFGAQILVISQFTLYGDARKGRRPTWTAAAPRPVAEPLYEAYCAALAEQGAHVERGVFGADMAVELINDGPVTLILEKP